MHDQRYGCRVLALRYEADHIMDAVALFSAKPRQLGCLVVVGKSFRENAR